MIPMAVAADRSVVLSREVRAQRVSRVMPRADRAIHAALAVARR
ncbi:hypothetical protein RSUY_08240 [Ralstonia solanacearum]|nr:hypothetical protein RSUY_08240 [Ralstonia solanacearum]